MEVQKLEMRLDSFEPRISQAGNAMEKGKTHLEKLDKAELEKLRAEVTKAIKTNAVDKKLSQEDLFVAIDQDGDGAVSKADLGAFLEGCKDLELGQEKLDRLFASFQLDAKGTIAKDTFVKFVRVVYKVIKETVLTTDRTIKGSKTIRRLEVDEYVEVLEGPLRDENVDVLRVRGVAIKDDLAGWATVVGNNGSIFMEETKATGAAPPTAAAEKESNPAT